MKEFPEDYELLSFFETEPEVLDKEMKWYYNTLTFSIERSDEKVTVYISPAYGEIEIFWERNDVLMIHWKLFNIQSVKIEKKDDKEYMRIISTNEFMDDCFFFMKPSIKLIGGMKLNP